MDRTENTVPHLLFPNAAMQICLFVEPLLMNDCCIFVYSLAAAEQLIYISHWSLLKDSSRTAYRHTAISSPRAVLVTSVIGLAILPCGSFLTVITLQLFPLLPP
jgi:hypothetical protein